MPVPVSRGAGGISKAFVKSYLKVKGHGGRTRDGGPRSAGNGTRVGEEVRGARDTVERSGGVEKRAAGNVKAEPPDDQRALKEDWVASVATRLTRRVRVRTRACVCGEAELT